MNIDAQNLALLGERLQRRFTEPPRVSWVLWKQQDESRDLLFLRSLRLVAVALRVPMPPFGRTGPTAKDTIPWYGIRAEHIAALKTHFTHTLPKPKARNCVRVLVEGMEIVRGVKAITAEEMAAIYKAAGVPSKAELIASADEVMAKAG